MTYFATCPNRHPQARRDGFRRLLIARGVVQGLDNGPDTCSPRSFRCPSTAAFTSPRTNSLSTPPSETRVQGCAPWARNSRGQTPKVRPPPCIFFFGAAKAAPPPPVRDTCARMGGTSSGRHTSCMFFARSERNILNFHQNILKNKVIFVEICQSKLRSAKMRGSLPRGVDESRSLWGSNARSPR